MYFGYGFSNMSLSKKLNNVVDTLLGVLARVLLPAVMLVVVAISASWAQSVQRIAAIVNDEVISGYDLQQRMSLVLSSSGLQPSPEALKRLEPQVLRTLVDERLQLQEAERNEIQIETREIAEANLRNS